MSHDISTILGRLQQQGYLTPEEVREPELARVVLQALAPQKISTALADIGFATDDERLSFLSGWILAWDRAAAAAWLMRDASLFAPSVERSSVPSAKNSENDGAHQKWRAGLPALVNRVLSKGNYAQLFEALDLVVPEAGLNSAYLAQVAGLSSVHHALVITLCEHMMNSRCGNETQFMAVETLARVVGAETARPGLESVARKHDNPALRAKALEALAALGENAAQDILLERALNDTHEQVQLAAINRLSLSRTSAVQTMLAGIALGRGSEQLLLAAIEALGNFTDQATFETLEKIAQDETKTVDLRVSAINGLGVSEDARGLRTLENLTAMDEPDEIRISAIRALGRLGYPYAVTVLEGILLTEEDSVVIQVEAIKALGNRGGNSTRRNLLYVAQSNDNLAVRLAAITNLGCRNDPELGGVKQLTDLAMTDPNSKIRKVAVEVLGELNPAVSESIFIDVLRRERDAEVRITALSILFGRGSIEELEALALDSKADTRLRILAIKILGKHGDVSNVRVVGRVYLRDPDLVLKQAALVALGELGGLEATDILLRVVWDDVFTENRLLAIRQLVGLNSQDSGELLSRLAVSAKDEEVRLACVEAFGELRMESAEEILKNIYLGENSTKLRMAALKALSRLKSSGYFDFYRERARVMKLEIGQKAAEMRQITPSRKPIGETSFSHHSFKAGLPDSGDQAPRNPERKLGIYRPTKLTPSFSISAERSITKSPIFSSAVTRISPSPALRAPSPTGGEGVLGGVGVVSENRASVGVRQQKTASRVAAMIRGVSQSRHGAVARAYYFRLGIHR